jgi:hypothetical protein
MFIEDVAKVEGSVSELVGDGANDLGIAIVRLTLD